MTRYILTFILTLATLLAYAQQAEEVGITIGGDVYGGGKQGAVGTGNTTATNETATTAVTLINAETNVTDVTITTEAVVRTVFGGGMNGRVYGQTNVTVDDGTVGAEKWNGTIHGGVFGAGDGTSAYVFGKTNTVTIQGGTIYNNIYGGGNQADLIGSTAVILQDGNLYGSVFGGARMANIFGHSYVNLDGANVPVGKTLIVAAVYGGNDISGTIATSTRWAWTQPDMPFTPSYKAAFPDVSFADKTWSAFVRSTCRAAENNNIFVGALYGGGNGDYTYTDNSLTLTDMPAEGANAATTKTFTNLSKPELAKAYLNIEAGTYGQMFGGGNNATVTGSTDIMVWNQNMNADGTAAIASIPASRIPEMGLHESFYDITGTAPANASDPDTRTAKLKYQVERLFGGNNKAAMDIRPNWYLARGSFNNIYSGGNRGEMTHAKGIVINIGSRSVYVNNVYGGCRLADVHPMGTDLGISEEKIPLMQVAYNESGAPTGLDKQVVTFEDDLAARVFISAGHINNVYGGNDISGRVYLGTNVKIAGAISGNVFGGGNGSYAYTDNASLKDHAIYGDYYYDPITASSIDALNLKRPHVDNTMLHIFGEDGQQPQIAADGTVSAKTSGCEPVIVTGGVYCGGNSATLDNLYGTTPKATFKIGKNVIINAVFMGSNGAEMVTEQMMGYYKNGYPDISGQQYSTINFTIKDNFAKYMDGCAVNIRPTITYDWTSTEDPHTYIGSLYGGGNVGSVTCDKAITLNIPAGLKIYDRVVGGCRAADIDARDGINAAYEGGINAVNTGTDATKPKLTINMDAYLEPRELITTLQQDGKFLSSAKLGWDKRIYFKAASAEAAHTDGGVTDKFTTLYGANLFGGCYASGHIAGDVTINLTRDLVSPDVISMVAGEATAETKVLNGLSAAEEFEKMGNYVFAKAMTIYGGGYGEPTTIRGDVRVNLSQNARVLNVMGGADYGMIGTTAKTGWHAAKAGNAYVTAAQGLKDYSAAADGLPYNCMQIYGGAFFGTIYGHTELRLNGGTYLNAFGGSCDADIADYTSVYLGNSQTVGSGYPYISGYVFGGNDFGGVIGRDGSESSSHLVAGTDFGSTILGFHDFSGTQAGYQNRTIRTTRYLEYNSGRVGLDPQGTSSIYGGSYGSYDYNKWFKKTNPFDNVTSVDYPPTTRTDKYPVATEYIPAADGIFVSNTYVNVRSTSANKEKDYIARGIFGGGRGVMEKLGIVDALQTYVYLHGATWASRGGNLSYDIYGGGYYSLVEGTKVDLESGCTSVVYGGSYGTSAKTLQDNNFNGIAFNSTRTEVNLYDGMDNANMAIFGGGGYVGATDTYVNLYGGKAKKVYGGSYNEGYCHNTHILVPDANNTVTGTASTAAVNAIYGGGYGNDVSLPCDEKTTNIDWRSSTAYVADMIYGGNNAKRAAQQTNVNIYAPVRKAENGNYVNIFGAGNGESTVAGFTNITLHEGARVNNVYGGGRDGKVFSYYKNISGAENYYKDENAHDYLSWTATSAEHNTNIIIAQGATATNVYGAGYGSNATVAGNTQIQLNGGLITDNLFGGGENGNVLSQRSTEKANESATEVLVTSTADYMGDIYTSSIVKGGQVNTVYGGGYNGRVGTDHDAHTGETRVEIGIADATDHYNGVPNILRSVYGGGYKGAIYGTANITMNNGYIGYDYVPSDQSLGIGTYTEHLAASAEDTHNLLKESGNIFGGGFGEGATTDHSVINMYDGVIRNSLYGGGEIASIGVADPATIKIDDRTHIPDVLVAGSTEVNLYGGLVSSNVFGGGRGYAIDAYGFTQTGEVGYSDGYTFGKTRVNIHRGTIGTDATLEEGNGNVFGGGNVGYVYGADAAVSGTKKNVTKQSDGYYHIGGGLMSEDCKVVVSPVCKALKDGTVNGVTYSKGDIISLSALDAISSSNDWHNDVFGNLDDQGVIIRNAVFAGGNVSEGSDKVYANTKTVYGNATASVIDCLSKDLITLGNDDIGGLYGDGNLTFVDGYRELNITNFGTDYYTLQSELSLEQYTKLNSRERAYFELKYSCNSGYTGAGGTYTTGQIIAGSDYDQLPDEEKSNWTIKGFCTLYAGRMMNTLQRADFCGVYGSRMVLKGAQDRVPSEVDYTRYTINRIGELSLNQVHHGISSINGGSSGNYFGIYSIVNLLGALTSDVSFYEDTRITDSESYPKEDAYNTYYKYKEHYLKGANRNNGTSKNKVSLASGVWLEIVKQIATGDAETDKDVYNIYSYSEGDKIYGPITGIVELDLINAAMGEGGGYVYALNSHGVQSASNAVQTTLTSANQADGTGKKLAAISYKQFQYSTMSSDTDMETSGNFVNSVKRIVDDCYPHNGRWLPGATPTSTAHYWFLRGEYYVYDQYISAYTGAAQSYAQAVQVPLTITAGAQGRLRLLNVQQNLNAYWTDAQYAALNKEYKVDGDNSCIVINATTYHKNTPISYWDWIHLTNNERSLFTTDTYVCNAAIGDYAQGQVLTSAEYTTAQSTYTGKYLVESDFTSGTVTYHAGDLIETSAYNALTYAEKGHCRLATSCFNVTNAVTSDNGFLLTYDWNNPERWGDYYIKPDASSPENMILASVHKGNATYSGYMLSPTFLYTDTQATTLRGQNSYAKGDLITETVHSAEPENASTYTTDTQAQFEKAYVAKEPCKLVSGSSEEAFVKGAAVSKSYYDAIANAADRAHFEEAYICTQTYQVSDDKFYTSGDLVTATEYSGFTDGTVYFSPAYICSAAGAWGGKLYTSGQNYAALDYCSLPKDDRSHFVYNLDAFETLMATSAVQTDVITNYQTSEAYSGLTNYNARHTNLYAASTPIDYTAIYTGGESGTETLALSHAVTVGGTSKTQLTKGDEISREDFEGLVNEPAHYASFEVKTGKTGIDYYIVTSEFWLGDTRYGVGKVLTSEEYNSLSSNQDNFSIITGSSSLSVGVHYCCIEDYTSSTGSVTKGTVIDDAAYDALKNEQKDFEVKGTVPTETSTLYVSRETDINSLNEDKIVTVVYEYSYLETTENGAYETVKERHVINIHIQFESGVPTVGELLAPPAVLPGTSVGLNQPVVSKGAYEILGGGWEIYDNDQDALTHTNGQEYTNSNTKMYWYENGYQVAYYAKSYLGKTYSNSVPITVANYHRMADVVANNGDNNGDGVADYMYLNEAAKNHVRNPKVYIQDAAELDNFASFFALTKEGADGFEDIRQCANLEFILDGDIDYTATSSGSSGSSTSWSSIGDAEHCFSGNFHGDGHTISGLDHSLFASLCGNVYNTGVTGTFTGSGITDAGDGGVYNCWIVTTPSPSDQSLGTTKAIHGGTGPVTNCYYYNNYGTREGATQKPLKAFLSGEVAYNLNGYYLAKRYYDSQSGSSSSASSSSAVEYKYWPLEPDGTLASAPRTGHYPAGTDRYVETRYGNEDFIYADGVIPVTANIRKDKSSYYPVYPDDYIFFGQNLSYDIVQGGGDYVDQPEAVHRQTDLTDEAQNTKLLATTLTESNRVYRAPAYYKSSVMKAAHFNQHAAFAGTVTLAADNIYGATSRTTQVYHDLTALDLTGHNDAAVTNGSSQTAFYKPFLDYKGLAGYTTDGLTRNLLVYADPTRDATSYGILDAALPEATFSYGDNGYHDVAIATDADIVKGHLVDKKAGNAFIATRDLYLVDREVFNCPITYTFDKDSEGHDCYMWYQRQPDNYVDASKGWEAISLPFTADLVSTQDKGEITHFYHKAGSTFTKGYDSGHEYWLREFKGEGTAPANPAANTFYAAFNYPEATGSYNKTDDNVFLWDYYYSHDDNEADGIDQDANEDEYQQQYYATSRIYSQYPLYAAAVPYIIGFPGSRYYEFDLSGTFVAQNRYHDIDKLDAQTISFVSPARAVIAVSDDELSTHAVTTDGVDITYRPNYMDTDIAAGSFVLNGEGSSFDKTTTVQPAVPFRPYFSRTPGIPFDEEVEADDSRLSPARSDAGVNTLQRIVIGSPREQLAYDADEEKHGEAISAGDGYLIIYVRHGDIIVRSECQTDQPVAIHSASGLKVSSFTIAPGQTIVTPIPYQGVYIVNKMKYFVK